MGTSAEADLDLDAGGSFLDCHKLVAETHDQRWGKLGDLALSQPVEIAGRFRFQPSDVFVSVSALMDTVLLR